MNRAKEWIHAARLRTLPLALASIGLGSFLAAFEGKFRWPVFILSGFTTVFLQILSNLANDYGDAQHGADNLHREGPSRAVQSGKISPKSMKTAIYLFIGLSLISGIALLLISTAGISLEFLGLLIIGFLAIGAALNYTMGKNPYGYAGFGDLFVILFFGFVGVMGTCFCHTGTISWPSTLPALSCGLLSTAVLNVNNMRDIVSDEKAGKLSIPVRIGRRYAVIYHWLLILISIIAASVFVMLNYRSPVQFLFFLSTPLLFYNGYRVASISDPKHLDPFLRQMAISTLVFIVTFGIGILI
ncbi:MAG: 1,4-dihydroxy-2-naphthoate polyprenyltransferase [Cytophagales bacterium]|nr:1,4-dihydroxy-2-naphthoate polyprenyltransferase [Cytophagales bacterium]